MIVLRPSLVRGDDRPKTRFLWIEGGALDFLVERLSSERACRRAGDGCTQFGKRSDPGNCMQR